MGSLVPEPMYAEPEANPEKPGKIVLGPDGNVSKVMSVATNAPGALDTKTSASWL